MKLSLKQGLLGVALLGLTSLFPLQPANSASTFGELEIDQRNLVGVASPFGANNENYNFLIIQQIPGKRQCWNESGTSPVVVDPLLLTFDFTGNCDRKTDSNGYSIRYEGQDLGLKYLLVVERRGEDVFLVGRPREAGLPEYIIARSNGYSQGFLKLFLEQGWRFTQRTYNGKPLGHIYLSYGAGTPIPTDSTIAFKDISTDIYKAEIEQAVSLGFIAGFKEDSTFRPQNPLTREQVVAMVIGALGKVPNLTLTIPTTTTGNPYADVPANRWSAARIAWAKQNNLVSGYPDGSFRPEQAVTRGELMAILKKMAQFAKQQQGKPTTLTLDATIVQFTDTSGHWANGLINEMAGYCKVASPVNETGTRFSPNDPSRRNYAAAATLRTLNCLKQGK